MQLGAATDGKCSWCRKKVRFLILAVVSLVVLVLTSHQLGPAGVVMQITDVKHDAVQLTTKSHDTVLSRDTAVSIDNVLSHVTDSVRGSSSSPAGDPSHNVASSYQDGLRPDGSVDDRLRVNNVVREISTVAKNTLAVNVQTSVDKGQSPPNVQGQQKHDANASVSRPDQLVVQGRQQANKEGQVVQRQQHDKTNVTKVPTIAVNEQQTGRPGTVSVSLVQGQQKADGEKLSSRTDTTVVQTQKLNGSVLESRTEQVAVNESQTVKGGGSVWDTHQLVAYEQQKVKENILAWGADQPAVQSRSKSNETQHVFFLKVHKAASSTVQNVMLRFALSRQLLVVLQPHSHILSETSKRWREVVMPLPPGRNHYDMLCNHLVFHEVSVRSLMPLDTAFVAIVRQPFEQFVSAFMYYRNKYALQYLKKIEGTDPLAQYFQDPAKFDTPSPAVSMTHNRMSFDFGLSPSIMNIPERVMDYIAYLNRTFHLVLVSERFDESMILLKRTLGWRTKDVLYFKNNVYIHREYNFTDAQREVHRNFNSADYALYDHFSQVFDKRVAAQGPDFAEEVNSYTAVLESVRKFCTDLASASFKVDASRWNDAFEVTTGDCELMAMQETVFVDYVRNQQYPQRVRRSTTNKRRRPFDTNERDLWHQPGLWHPAQVPGPLRPRIAI